MKEQERVNLANEQLTMQSTKNMLQRAKERRGITLVALVITILIIIILATVSLVFIFGEDGIVARAEQAKLETEVASIKEQLEMAKATALIDGKGHIDMDHYWEILEDEEIIGSKDTDVSNDDGDGTYEVITDGGFIFDITPVPDEEDTTDIEIDYVGTAEGPRISNIEITDKTSNSVTVKVTATNANKATYKYEYKKVGESNWTVVEGQEGDTGIITGLEQGATYEIRVTVETNQGTASKTTGTTLGEIPTGKVQFTEAVWGAGNKASVIISTEETGYTLQYQINGYEEGKWEDVASGETIGDLSYGDTVYGRLTDGTNESDHASVTVEDKTAPQAAAISLSSTSVKTGEVITATVTLADNESGINIAESKWVYNTNAGTIGTEDESQYTGGNFTSNPQEIPLTATTAGTYYLHVLTKDIAGNKVETVSEVVTVKKIATNVEELGTAEYVEYVDGTGVTRLCAVLYDNSSPYGVEIITMETVEKVELGNGTGETQKNNTTYFNVAMNSYNNALSILNNATNKYLNTTYADKVRCVGTNPENPTVDTNEYFTATQSYIVEYLGNYNGKFKNADNNYLIDSEQMEALGIVDISEDYWIMRRVIGCGTYDTYFDIKCLLAGGGQFGCSLCYIEKEGNIQSVSISNGLRPVFHLKQGIKITGGSGTKTDPYTLGT